MLEQYLRQRRRERDILLMTHIVLGYPSFKTSMGMIEAMVKAGVDLMELQIPFSEPIADGPVIQQANAAALAAGSTVERCLDFAAEVTGRFEIPFLFITYYNILHRFGVKRFVGEMAARGIRGSIVPDLPPEEAQPYLEAMNEAKLAPIFIFSPNSSDARLAYLGGHARGFVYCVTRTGVTGGDTQFSGELDRYLGRCRAATGLPLAVGFGIKDRRDVEFLVGKADIAIVGSETHRVLDRDGLEAVGPYIASLRGSV